MRVEAPTARVAGCAMDLLSSLGSPVRHARWRRKCFFRFATLRACLLTDDAEFRARFLRIFHDCLDPTTVGSDALYVTLQLTGSYAGGPVVATISPHNDDSAGAVLASLFPALNLGPADCEAVDGWQLLARVSDSSRPVIATNRTRIVIDRELPWQTIVAQYFINDVMRKQADLSFLHGASVAIGTCGVLLSGDKGSGKSTLSLALAARGHGFLGDEIAAIDSKNGTLLPFPRAASIRVGPQARAISPFLAQNQLDWEVLPDGTRRFRVPVSRICPSVAAHATEMTHAFFLTGMSSTARAAPFEFSWDDLALLAPLQVTFMSKSVGERTLTFLGLFRRVRCYKLSPGGSPDETADLVQKIVEVEWDTPYRKGRSVLAHIAG